MLSLLLFICPLAIALSNDPCRRNESIEIHTIGFFPCTDPNDTRGIPVDNCDGIERIPIIKLALEEINERCDLLPGYRLVMNYANSACSSIPALHHFIKLTDPSLPHKPIILGPACSAANFIMGEIAERLLNITQVSYRSGSALFTADKISYPRFFRLTPRSQQFVDIAIAIVNEFKWKRVAMVTYATDFLFNLARYTEQQLQESKVNILTNQIFANNDPRIVIDEIKNVNARIIIAWLPIVPHVIIKFWCMAVKNQLTGPEFVWILPGWYRPGWWNVSGINCTADEMKDGLEYSLAIAINSVIANNLSRVIVSGKNVSQFQKDLARSTKVNGNVQLDTVLSVGYTYDAVWTIALALNSSISILEERGLGRLEDFTYDSVEMADVFSEAISKTSFQGISGKVSFQNNGNRNDPLISLIQYRNGVAVPVIIYNNSCGPNNFIELNDQSLMWKGGYIPRGAPNPKVHSDRAFEIGIALIATVLGILSTIYFFAFNICHRNNLIVKRSSYRLNSLILTSALVGFAGTLLHVIQLDSDMSDTFTAIICNVRHWMTELAFIVCFATFFVKIWRLYKLFINEQLAELRYLNDRYLLVMIVLIVIPALLVLVIQIALLPVTLHVHTEIDKDDPVQEETFFSCEGEHYLIFDVVLLIYDIFLGLLNAFIAYQTKRHLPTDKKYRRYHESAVINLATMMAIILSSSSKLVAIFFQRNNNHDGILLLITLRECFWLYPVIFLLFMPKVYRVYHGILQSRKQPKMLQHQSPMHHCAISTRNDAFPNIALQKKRKRLSSESIPVPFIFSNDTVISTCEQIDYGCPQQPAVSLFLDPDPAECCNVIDDSEVLVVITNIAAVNETTELHKIDDSTNSD